MWLPCRCGTATAFNLQVVIGALLSPLETIGDIRFSRSIANAGLSGIAVTSVSFKSADFPTIGADVPIYFGNAIGNLPTFFLNKEVWKDGITTVEALDRCAYLDTPIDTAPNDEPWDVDDGNYLTTAFVKALKDQCGFSSVQLPYTKAEIPCERIDGKTFQTVLSEMSQAYCGFFCCHSGTSLSFIQYSSGSVTENITKYSRISPNGSLHYNSVVVTDGERYLKYGGSTPPTLNINSQYVDIDNPDAVYYWLSNAYLSDWNCENAVSTQCNLPILGDKLRFMTSPAYGFEYKVLRVDARVVGSELLLSVGADVPNGGYIARRGLMQQKLDDAVSTAKLYGTVKIIDSGISLIANDKDLITP